MTENLIGKWAGALLCSLVITGMSGCTRLSDMQNQVRQPAVAGTFYPEKNKELNAILKKAFRSAPAPKLAGEVKALLVPHAAYKYSGVITAMAMKSIAKKDIDTIYILGTSHYADAHGAIIWQGRAWRTPLGLYPVDIKGVKELLKACPDIHVLERAWSREHSVEVQIPYLQTLAPNAEFIPMVMGTSTWEEVWSVARAIADHARDKKALIVISSDLSHYPTMKEAKIIDNKMLNAMESYAPYKLDEIDSTYMAQGLTNLVCTVCGLSAVKTGMIAANLLGANDASIIHYANSGMITGDKDKVVGYGSVAFIKNGNKKPLVIEPVKKSLDDFDLTKDELNELVNIARAAIAEGLATGTQLKSTTAQKKLLEKHPVFVTLRKEGHLRGCIGITDDRLPLHQAVAQMACAAAFEDPRFQPLTSGELPYTEIELSVLSPLKRITDVKDIIIGVHGVMIKRGNRKGLFLPQVATENKWSKEEFLNNLCTQKAQLPSDAWRDKSSELYVFKVKTVTQEAPGL